MLRVLFEKNILYFKYFLTPVVLLEVEKYFSTVTVLLFEYIFSVLFPPLLILHFKTTERREGAIQ